MRRLGTLRLGVAVAGVATAFANMWLLPLPVAIFLALIVWHERLARRAQLEQRAVDFYEAGLARLDGNWPGRGSTGERFHDPLHPYARDLDLFGHGSVFQFLNAARTSVGEQTLASWLKAPASPEQARERQRAVIALRDRLDLREDLALLGEDVRTGVEPESLARWGERPPVPFPWYARTLAFMLVSYSAIAFAGYMLQYWRVSWALAGLLAQMALAFALRSRVIEVLAAADAPAEELDVLARVLDRFEREPLNEGRLHGLRAQLTGASGSASRRIARLHRLIELRDSERNVMYAPVAKLLMWSTQFALAIEAWRVANGPQVRRWLEAAGELEALSSLAGYAAERPNDPFPELVPEGPLFDGRAIAHPLLPHAVAVPNDVRLDRATQLLLVSGSNMSGKSTLLRAVGLNTVLAWAGAPVRAASLRVSPLTVGASMRVEDSVLEGKSRFYAEITRLRQVVELAGGSIPLLFLLDEVLSGTNSHDRRIGAAAILRTLVESGSTGLVTTHDLALAHIAEELAPHALNVHFEDQIENGAITFDYRMRPGVVAKSNAIELMRSVGLRV